MNLSDYRVSTLIGRYLVRRPNGNGHVTRTVTKNKQCSCGKNNCIHIQAVRRYLLDGGERAEPFKQVLPNEPAGPNTITVCPVCETKVEWARSYTYPLMWKCPEDLGHYWEWRGQGKVKAFLTGGRPTGIPGIDILKPGEYKEFLDTQEEMR